MFPYRNQCKTTEDKVENGFHQSSNLSRGSHLKPPRLYDNNIQAKLNLSHPTAEVYPNQEKSFQSRKTAYEEIDLPHNYHANLNARDTPESQYTTEVRTAQEQLYEEPETVRIDSNSYPTISTSGDSPNVRVLPGAAAAIGSRADVYAVPHKNRKINFEDDLNDVTMIENVVYYT